jgi:hypothetical protein
MTGSTIRRSSSKTAAGVGVDAHKGDQQNADREIDKIEHDAGLRGSAVEMRHKRVSNPFGIAASRIRKT